VNVVEAKSRADEDDLVDALVGEELMRKALDLHTEVHQEHKTFLELDSQVLHQFRLIETLEERSVWVVTNGLLDFHRANISGLCKAIQTIDASLMLSRAELKASNSCIQ